MAGCPPPFPAACGSFNTSIFCEQLEAQGTPQTSAGLLDAGASRGTVVSPASCAKPQCDPGLFKQVVTWLKRHGRDKVQRLAHLTRQLQSEAQPAASGLELHTSGRSVRLQPQDEAALAEAVNPGHRAARPGAASRNALECLWEEVRLAEGGPTVTAVLIPADDRCACSLGRPVFL